jgi:DNA-binding response OmpR family regulator
MATATQLKAPPPPIPVLTKDGPDATAPPSKRRLLLVEDEWLAFTALQAIFKQKGWDVTVATTVEQAMRQLESKPDWLVLDLMLPDGDGAAVLKRIREKRLPIRVAVTSGTSDRDRIRAVESLQPDAYFSKPVDMQQLLQTVNR